MDSSRSYSKIRRKMQHRWYENDSCAHFVALVGYLANEVILPQGDSEVDYSNFLVGLGL